MTDPVNILEIRKVSENNNIKTTYILKEDELAQCLEPIKNKNIAVIPIVGPSRKGKSFILNYMSRYLSGCNSTNWIGDKNEPLKGFHWKADIKPQTSGIWLSKPYLVKRSDDTEIAVILIDTQGVFDAYLDVKDWSTIVGFSLLLSSCLIFNVPSDLQEDILTSLETYLKYGKVAAQAHEGQDVAKPFQKLFFLIRDWGIPHQFPFGLKGGRAFLNEKLKIEEEQAEQAKRNRELIKNTFDEVECFLMPNIGEKGLDFDFDGCIEQLDPRFSSNMQRLIDHLLNPDNIELKKIKNKEVTCGELVHYFKSYVEIFNGDQLPSPEAINSATEKVAYLIKLEKLKKKHAKKLKSLVSEDSFIAIQLLQSHHEKIQNEFIEDMEKSEFFTPNESAKVYKQFKDNYEEILEQMIKRRILIMEQCVIKCEVSYEEKLKQSTGNKLVDAFELETIFNESKIEILNNFKSYFNGEEEIVFNKEMYLLTKKLNQLDMECRDHNNKLKKKFDMINLEIRDEMVNNYNTHMSQILMDKTILNENSFKKFEKDLRQKIINSFQKKVEINGLPLDLNVQVQLERKLKECRERLKEQFQETQESMEENAKQQFRLAIESYERNINDFVDSSATSDNLDKKHQLFSTQAISQFSSSCLTNDELFLEPFKNELKQEINKIYNNLKQREIQKHEEIQNQYKIEADIVQDHYSQGMQDYISNHKNISDEELKRLHKKLKSDLMTAYKQKFNSGLGIDASLTAHSSELREVLDDEFEKFQELNMVERDKYVFELKSNELLKYYENNLNQNKHSLNNEQALKQFHDQIVSRIADEFKSLRPVSGKVNPNIYLDNLNRKISQVYNEMISHLKENNRKMNELERIVKEFVSNYENKMNILLGDDKYYSDKSLENFHRKYKRDTINNLVCQFESDGHNESLHQHYKDKSDHLIEEKFAEFCQINKDRREVQDRLIGDKIKKYLKLYEFDMKEVLDTVECEEELITHHQKYEAKYIKQLRLQNSIRDPDLMMYYTNGLKEELGFCFNTFRAKSNNNEIKKKIIEAKNNYIQKMKRFVESDETFSKNLLFDSHDNWKKHSNMLLESKLSESNLVNIEKYLTDLNALLDAEFETIQINIESRQKSVEQQLEIKVEELALKYHKNLNKSMHSFESELNLRETQQALRREILDLFLELNKTTERSVLNSYRKQLEDKIETSIEESLELWKTQSVNNEKVFKYLKLDVRKMYSDEMNKYVRSEPYLLSDKLEKCNETVLTLLYDRYNKEKGNMTDEKYMKFIRESVEDLFRTIKDKNSMNIPVSPAIGIDLGTTNSCVAYYKKNQVIIIPNELKRSTTPSFVSLRDNEDVVGDLAKEEIFSYHKNTIHSAKRLIGREINDPSVQKYLSLMSYDVINDGCNNPKISVRVNRNEKTYFPEEISAILLKKLKTNAEKYLSCPVTKAVITVPAYFNDAQKDATKFAGKMAGLEVLKIINEPTASAIAYSLNQQDDIHSRNVLIYDYGGGTFDVAVLEVDKGNINVKSVGGDNNLGGDDFDNNIMEYCLKRFTGNTGLVLQPPEKEVAICRLRQECEKHKCRLTSIESTGIQINSFYEEQDLNVVLTRKKFEEINADLIVRSMDLVDKALKDAKLSHSDINDIVLVGGTTRIPKVRQLLSQKFNGRALNQYLDPDEVVARGAAIQAAILNGQQAGELDIIQLSDVTPMSLGIEIGNDVMSVIIPRNSKLPCVKTQQYQTSSDFDNQIVIKVYEGESDLCSQNHQLGSFVLNGIPPALVGKNILVVKFAVNDEGLLNVSAKIEGTGVENVIQIDEYRGRLNDKKL